MAGRRWPLAAVMIDAWPLTGRHAAWMPANGRRLMHDSWLVGGAASVVGPLEWGHGVEASIVIVQVACWLLPGKEGRRGGRGSGGASGG